MLVLALAIAVMSMVWYFAVRKPRVDPAIRRAGVACAIFCVAVAVALRAGPVAGVLLVVTVASLVLWLRMRGRGGDDPGDDGRDPPSGPEPDPGPDGDDALRPELLDPDAFDRARAEWERELPKRG